MANRTDKKMASGEFLDTLSDLDADDALEGFQPLEGLQPAFSLAENVDPLEVEPLLREHQLQFLDMAVESGSHAVMVGLEGHKEIPTCSMATMVSFPSCSKSSRMRQ